LKKKNASACRPIYIIIYVNRDSSCLIGPEALHFLCLYMGAKCFEIRTKSVRFTCDRHRLHYTLHFWVYAARAKQTLRVRLAQKVNTILCTNSCDLRASNKKKSCIEACIRVFGSNCKHNTKWLRNISLDTIYIIIIKQFFLNR
jgi:hypothetical protein